MKPFKNDDDAKALIAHNFRRLRKEHPKLVGGRNKSTIYGVAKELGTYPTNIKRISDGEVMPGAALLYHIAKVFGVPMDEFFRVAATAARPRKSTTAKQHPGAEALLMLAKIMGIKPSDRR